MNYSIIQIWLATPKVSILLCNMLGFFCLFLSNLHRKQMTILDLMECDVNTCKY